MGRQREYLEKWVQVLSRVRENWRKEALLCRVVLLKVVARRCVKRVVLLGGVISGHQPRMSEVSVLVRLIHHNPPRVHLAFHHPKLPRKQL